MPFGVFKVAVCVSFVSIWYCETQRKSLSAVVLSETLYTKTSWLGDALVHKTPLHYCINLKVKGSLFRSVIFSFCLKILQSAVRKVLA